MKPVEKLHPFLGNPDVVLDGAKGQLESVMIIGRIKGSEEIYVASSLGGGPEVTLWVLEKGKQHLLDTHPMH